jgi:hypothetical protein
MRTKNDTTDIRRRAAALARDYLANRITWQEFMDSFTSPEFEGDKLIDALIDLVEHEPKQGGFLGVNEKEWIQYQHAIQDLMGQLERDDEGSNV